MADYSRSQDQVASVVEPRTDPPPYDFKVYRAGLLHASVCTNLTDEQATGRLNTEHPTGISAQWAVCDGPFADGTPNGATCPGLPTHRHVLFIC
ncbi:hypothetical protein Ssi03_62310 [Sphaerisporangium siamense]|uniref:Uncharacterized protein n=1 Tax=Sphaerisporangium siamense TaxID=795645 RepID=A0A7W7D957_9ACTN|nr:hypothetical protein [Sphaerisporangium siamense]MBB4702542.1 hypothetical protein [Sphaerisporangium siamense]GII88241.1 hypothetical protein Ssi03_62310 [Sphaerisporangium siamense]